VLNLDDLIEKEGRLVCKISQQSFHHVTRKDLPLPPPRIIIIIIIIIIITVIIIINNDNVLAKKDSLNPVTVTKNDSIYRIGKNFFKHKLSIPSQNLYQGMDLDILS